MTWLDAYTLLDLETTDRDPLKARIVTAAVIHMGDCTSNGEPRETHTWMIRPDGYDIPAETVNIHGITTARALDEGTDGLIAIGAIANELVSAMDLAIPVIGHNIATYDLAVIELECARYGVPGLTERMGGARNEVRPVIDTCTMGRHMLPYLRRGPDGKRHSLANVCRELRQPFAEYDAHGAEYDALAAGRIAYAMGWLALNPDRAPEWMDRRDVRRIAQIADMSFDELHDSQARWHAAWAEETSEYRRRMWVRDRDAAAELGEAFDKPEPEPIDPRWPLIPAVTS